jgi:hypothetical protein
MKVGGDEVIEKKSKGRSNPGWNGPYVLNDGH